MIRLRTLAIGAFIAIAVTQMGLHAYALRGEITEPSGIAFSSDYPENARLEVERALADSGAEFVRGHFINWISTLHFRGDVSHLNTMVGRLCRCHETVVAIKLDEWEEDCEWSIVHDATSNRFQITINLRSSKIRLKELEIPEIGRRP